MFPESVMRILDGGRDFNGGNPPAVVGHNATNVPNPQRKAPPQTILGREQKAWFKDKLRTSTATWKIWGNSLGALDSRADPQNLPAGLAREPWPPHTYAALSGYDYGTAWTERTEVYRLVRDANIMGFAIVSGDRHSFWAGYAAAALPPAKYPAADRAQRAVGRRRTSLPGRAHRRTVEERRAAAAQDHGARRGHRTGDVSDAFQARRPSPPAAGCSCPGSARCSCWADPGWAAIREPGWRSTGGDWLSLSPPART